MTALETLYSRRSEILSGLADVDKRETAKKKNYLEHEDYKRLSDELQVVGNQVTVQEAVEGDRKRRADLERDGEKTTGGGLEGSRDNGGEQTRSAGPYKSLGAELVDVVRAGTPDGPAAERAEALSRLDEVRTISGLSTEVGKDGGFLVQKDQVASIWQRTYELGQMLSRAWRIPISGGANGTKLMTVKESSRATGSRYGGVRGYWAAEGGTVDASKVAIDPVSYEVEKLMALVYLTDEVITDAAQMEALARQLVPQELAFKMEDAMYSGNGAGIPLGVMNSPCLVTVDAETGQAAKTIVAENVINMRARIYGRSRANSIWTINQDIEPQLAIMNIAVGTGGIPVYFPAGGLSVDSYDRLYARPVVPVEYSPTLGTTGDILAGDWSQYIVVEKGGIDVASSLHVRFIYDEMVLRWTWRVSGAPFWQGTLTPYKGGSTKTLSPFVALATRS